MSTKCSANCRSVTSHAAVIDPLYSSSMGVGMANADCRRGRNPGVHFSCCSVIPNSVGACTEVDGGRPARTSRGTTHRPRRQRQGPEKAACQAQVTLRRDGCLSARQLRKSNSWRADVTHFVPPAACWGLGNVPRVGGSRTIILQNVSDSVTIRNMNTPVYERVRAPQLSKWLL